MKMFLISASILLITIVFSEGSAVASGPLCRGRICDDRPECPSTTCRCIYPSRLYCDVYYHCLNGKPYQYRCSPGLYFNNDTLSCDYSYNVNCTLGTSPAATHTTSSMPPTANVEITNATTLSTTEETTTTEVPVITKQVITTKIEISTTTQEASTTLVPSTHKKETTAEASTTEEEKTTTKVSTAEEETSSAGISTTKEQTTTAEIRTTEETTTSEISTVSEEDLTTKIFKTTLEDTTTTSTKATEATKPSDITNIPVTLTTTEKVSTNSSFTTKSIEKTKEETISVSTVPPQPEFSCPSRFGLFPDPKSCFRFYHCSHWVPYPKWCPSGLHFNPTLRVCDWPYRAGCGKIQPSTIIDIQTTPVIPGEKNITHCDCDCCELPVPGECNAYILCIDKTAFKLTCDKDLYFNPMTGTCDLQENVHCETDVKCLEPFGRFSYPNSCRHFIECQNRVKTVKSCPEGLKFDNVTLMCSWTGSCGGNTYPPAIPETTDPSICAGCTFCFKQDLQDCTRYIMCINGEAFKEQCSEGLFFNSNSQMCDHDVNVDCPEPVPFPECPAENGYFPYPGECGLYLHCIKGTRYVKQCSGILHFDPKKKQCDWPWSAGCRDGSQISTPEPVSNTTTCDCNCCLQPVGNDCKGFILCIEYVGFKGSCSFGLLFNPKTENCDFPENVQCEVTPDPSGYQCPEYEGLFPHMDDCKKFIHCAHGFPYIKDCPANLHFNPTLKVCDWPYSAGCEGFPTVEPPPEDHKLPCDTCSSCFIPNEKDCAAYMYCKNGTAYKMRCSDNLLFNPQTEACDLASNVDCAVPPSGHCPKQDGLFPSTDCSKFIHCSNGIPYLKNCPDGLQFNSHSLVCDWPKNVNCDEPSIKPTEPDDENPIILNRTCDCECCFYRNEMDCSKYLLCLDGFLHEGKCSDGLLFNFLSQNCDLADRVDCGDLNPICSSPNGVFANPKDCSSYFRCSGGVPYLELCSKGKHFSTNTKQCLDPCDAKCDTSLDCAFSTPSIETTTKINPHCKAAYGLFPMPGSCRDFFSCLNYTRYVSQCPEGLHFNAEELLCQKPCDARCDLTIDCKSTPSTDTSTLSSSAPSICIDEYGMYPVEGDCSSFYQCSNGRPYIVKCPKGLHFNVEYETCEHPCDAQCDRSIDCTSPTTQISTSSASSTTSTTISPNCLKPDGLFPVADDCTSFYQCSNGQSHLVRCPSGLHFSHKHEVCEHPCEAKCDETIDCTSPTISSTSSTKHSTVSTTISPNCLQPDGLFPVQDDCKSFYQCSNGRAHLVRCPSGLHFSPEHQICEQPCEAKCDETIDCSSPTTESTSSSTTKISTTISPNCLQTDGLFPVENDCTSFYQCSSGRAHLVQCPSGLHFSFEYQICEHPCEAKCDVTIDCSSPTTESTSSSTTKISTTISPNCLQPDGLFPVENDCTSFYQCSNGRAHLVQCPSGLHFSPEYQICEHPCEAKCDVTIDCSSPTTESASSSTTFTISTTISPNCLQPDGLFPVENDCKSFYQCSNGRAHLVRCPSGLHFSPKYQICEHPCEAKCDVTIDCSSPTTESASSSTTFAISTTISPNCLQPDGLFPVENDCTSFYQCSSGRGHLVRCPSGLHFSPEYQICEHPCEAKCDNTIDCSSPTTESTSTVSITISPNCLQADGVFPAEGDCTSFYQCSNGRSHMVRCPSGLHFSPEYKACEHPCEAKCDETIDCTSPTTSNSLVSTVSTTMSPNCLQPNGLFPVAGDCTSFYQCANGHSHLVKCPSGLHFCIESQTCEHPCEAKCDPTIDCISSTTSTSTSSTTPSPNCPHANGFFPVKGSCESFYQCSNGQSYFLRCPNGLHFSFKHQLCEHPCLAECDKSIDCSSPTPEEVSSSTIETISTLSPHCLEPNGLYPADDCFSFYLCSNGKEHRIQCPPGLHFSAAHEECEDPCVARCDPDIECSTSTKPTTQIYSTPSTTYKPVSPECIEPEGLFPNPEDCGSFFQCSNGRAHLVRCPTGLHFSKNDEICEIPCVAGCNISVLCPTEIPDVEGNCTCESCFLPDPTDCSAYYFCSDRHLTKGYCPYGMLFDKISTQCKNEDEVDCEATGDPAMCPEPFGIFPYPGDCKKFLYCENSVAHVRKCDAELEFDPENKVCSTPKGYCGTVTMDPHCKRPTGLFPYAGNCSLFYQCENGVSYLKACNSPLLFNPQEEVCDWPENVECGKDKSTTLPPTSSTGSVEINTSTSTLQPISTSMPLTCLVVPGVICPCACRVPTYDDCSSFYQCQDDGMACKKYCPDGLYFNKREMVCDLPNNVECRDFFFTAMTMLKSSSRYSRIYS